MSLEAVKALVKRAFEDGEFKGRLSSEPERALSQFDLSAEEKEAIGRVHGQLGLVTGNSGELAAVLKPVVDWLAGGP